MRPSRYLPFALTAAALATSCTYPRFIARRTITDTVDLRGAQTLACNTHNGDITIHARPEATAIQMRVEMSVRGYTQDEADDNLRSLRVEPRTENGTLTLEGSYDSEVRRMSPSFSFHLDAPESLMTKLVTHNGDIDLQQLVGNVNAETHNGNIGLHDIAGDVRLHTHNGAVVASVAANAVELVSHNGRIALEVQGDGALDGSIVTHNGSVEVAVAESLGTVVDAYTHNGSLRLERGADGVRMRKRHLHCTLGNGGGELTVETHNGSVVVR